MKLWGIFAKRGQGKLVTGFGFVLGGLGERSKKWGSMLNWMLVRKQGQFEYLNFYLGGGRNRTVLALLLEKKQ